MNVTNLFSETSISDIYVGVCRQGLYSVVRSMFFEY